MLCAVGVYAVQCESTNFTDTRNIRCDVDHQHEQPVSKCLVTGEIVAFIFDIQQSLPWAHHRTINCGSEVDQDQSTEAFDVTSCTWYGQPTQYRCLYTSPKIDRIAGRVQCEHLSHSSDHLRIKANITVGESITVRCIDESVPNPEKISVPWNGWNILLGFIYGPLYILIIIMGFDFAVCVAGASSGLSIQPGWSYHLAQSICNGKLRRQMRRL